MAAAGGAFDARWDYLNGAQQGRLGGASAELLRVQDLLNRAVLPSAAALAALRRYGLALGSGTSASALDALRAGGPRVRQLRAGAEAAVAAVGLREDVTSVSLYLRPDFTCVTLRAGVALPPGCRLLGAMLMRPLPPVLFHILRLATAGNFALGPASGPPGAFAATTSFEAAHARLQADWAAEPLLMAAASATGLLPTLLTLVLNTDVTTVNTVDATGYYPAYVGVGNFTPSAYACAGARQLLALLPIYVRDAGLTARQNKAAAAALFQACMDHVYFAIAKCACGLLFEFVPGSVVLFVPRVALYAGDFPERGKVAGCIASPNARRPCMYCTCSRDNKNSTHNAAPKDMRDVLAHARVAPFPPAGASQAVRAENARAREAAAAFGATPLGRAPALLAQPAAVTRLWAHLVPPPDFLHSVPGGVLKTAVQAACEGSSLAPGERVARVSRLRPFSGAGTSLGRFSADALVRGAKLSTITFLSAGLVLPALLEGGANWDAEANALLLLDRLALALRQHSFSGAALHALDALTRATTRALRLFAASQRSIKAHILRHFSRFIRVYGSARFFDTQAFEALHRRVKRLHAATRAGDGRREAMLRLAGLEDAVAALVHAAGVRAGAAAPPLPPPAAKRARTDAAAAAEASAPPPLNALAGATQNMAGQFGAVAPPARAPLVPAAARGMASLGGVVPAGPFLALPPGGLDVPGAPGSRATGEPLRIAPGAALPPYARGVAEEVLRRLDVAPRRPATKEAALAWLRQLRDAVARNSRLDGSLGTFGTAAGPAAHVDRFGLTDAGVAALINGLARLTWTAVRVFGRLRLLDAATRRSVAPALAASALPAVSWPAPDPASANAAYGDFSMGVVTTFVSIPQPRELRAAAGAGGPRAPPSLFAAACLARHDAAEQAQLYGRIPAMAGLMEPWRLLRVDDAASWVLVPVECLIRREHVQPRFGAGGAGGAGDAGDALWRYPQGGAEGTVGAPLPLPAGVDVGESDAEDDEEGEEEGEGAGESEGESGSEGEGEGESEDEGGAGVEPADNDARPAGASSEEGSSSDED